MRAALAAFAFELGAVAAESDALATNARSIGVSTKLGYRDMPGREETIDGRLAAVRVFRLERTDWEARRATLPPVEIVGLDACRALLGAPPG